MLGSTPMRDAHRTRHRGRPTRPTMNAQTIPIVPITLAHAQSFHTCLDQVAREQRFLAQLAAPPLARVQDFVRDSVASDAAQFVALADGQVVGWADVFPHWAAALAHRGNLGMGVLPAWRRQGLGRRLLQACIDKAWARGISRIDLETRADNLAAIALYERMGFVHEATLQRGMRFGDRYFETRQMGLQKPGS